MNESKPLTILQYNVHKSQPRTHSVLNDPDSRKYTLLLLQEQYWSEYNKSNLQHPSWTLIEPPISAQLPTKQPRAVIYANKKLLPTASYAQINLPFSDVVAITIKTSNKLKPTLIINIYNPGDSNLITPLRQYLHGNINKEDYEVIIMAGDFNLHHPLWNPLHYHTHDDQADEVIEMLMEYELTLLLPPDTITFPTAGTTIDLIWGNKEAEQGVMKCHIAKDNDHSQ